MFKSYTSVLSCLQSNSESIEEEFHENLIYDRLYRQHSASSADSLDCRGDQPHELLQYRKSPSISNDSLDTKDHSDGMWNESVTTVCNSSHDVVCVLYK